MARRQRGELPTPHTAKYVGVGRGLPEGTCPP